MAFIQASTVGFSGNTVGPATAGAATGSAVGTGHGVVGLCIWQAATSGATGVTTITDNAGNTYTQPVATTGPTASGALYFFVFYKTNITGNPTSISATIPSGKSVDDIVIVWSEFSTELGSGITLVGSGAALNQSVADATGANSMSSSTVTSQAGGLIWSVGYIEAGAQTLTKGTSPLAFSYARQDNVSQVYEEYVAAAGASSKATWQASATGGSYNMGIMAFTPSGFPVLPTRQRLRTYALTCNIRH